MCSILLWWFMDCLQIIHNTKCYLAKTHVKTVNTCVVNGVWWFNTININDCKGKATENRGHRWDFYGFILLLNCITDVFHKTVNDNFKQYESQASHQLLATRHIGTGMHLGTNKWKPKLPTTSRVLSMIQNTQTPSPTWYITRTITSRQPPASINDSHSTHMNFITPVAKWPQDALEKYEPEEWKS
jgi:hypothetical protein